MKKLKNGDRVIINTGILFCGVEATIEMTLNVDGRKLYGVRTDKGLTGTYKNQDLLLAK